MTSKSDDEQGFLSRWSKRKLDEAELETKSEPVVEKQELEQQPDTDEKELPVWQQKDADPDKKKQALAALFKQSEFNDLDGLNEYDEDYTTFPKLGKVVTQEMKRMLKLAEEKTRTEPNLQQDKTAIEDNENSPKAIDDEDNKLV
jgi:hypothetical protein